MADNFFEIAHFDATTQGRAGIINTDHGSIETPIFMPVGTAGTVKAIHQFELSEVVHAQIILGNTYHLYLKPGTDIIQGAGGLHRFISWDRPLLTDSGGYQVYSLSERRKISEAGVQFSSHIDGSKHLFSPEKVIDIQREIGADILMAFDECPPYPTTYDYAEKSLFLTNNWLDRSFQQFNSTECPYGFRQVLAPIVQGSVFPDLRKKSADYVASKEAKLNAIGGLSVGEPAEEMYRMTELVCSILPQDKPRYLMGVGTPENLLESIALGIDMFDCVLPTRNARHGLLYTREGIINIKNKKWESDYSSIDAQTMTRASRYYSKGYLRHLILSKEILGAQIATQHNLGFYLQLMKDARTHILQDTFRSWKEELTPKLQRRI